MHRPLSVALGVHQGDGGVEQALAGLLAAELVQGGGHGVCGLARGGDDCIMGVMQLGLGLTRDGAGRVCCWEQMRTRPLGRLQWMTQGAGLFWFGMKNFIVRANLLNRPLRTRTVGGVGAGS